MQIQSCPILVIPIQEQTVYLLTNKLKSHDSVIDKEVDSFISIPYKEGELLTHAQINQNMLFDSVALVLVPNYFNDWIMGP